MSVYGSLVVTPRSPFVLDVWLYARKDADEVARRARRDGAKVERGTRGQILAPLGTEITLLLTLPGFHVDTNVETVYWTGDIATVQFLVEAPEGIPSGAHVGRLQLMHAGMLVASVLVELEVGPGEQRSNGLATHERYIRTGFASYASDDRSEVIRRVQGIDVAGVDVFLDVLNLRSRQRWKDEIATNIRDRDILYLFWSRAASKSEWVDFEWRYALSTKGIESIHPVPLEAPVNVPPELGSLHFYDVFTALPKN